MTEQTRKRIFDRKKIEAELADARLLPAFPFKKKGWKADLFESASHFVEDDFVALVDAIKHVSADDRMFVINYEMHGKPLPNDMPTEWEINLSWRDFDDKVQGAPLGSFGLYLWGPSQKWAVICSYGEYLVYGGEEAFIQYIDNRYGGRDKIRERFVKFVDEGGPNASGAFARQLIQIVYPEAG
jgi:hypothetical protein